MIEREFTVQDLEADGTPVGPPRPMPWLSAWQTCALTWPADAGLERLRHYFELARAAPGHPVDALVLGGPLVRYAKRITYQAHG